jgi:hypothetical protein
MPTSGVVLLPVLGSDGRVVVGTVVRRDDGVWHVTVKLLCAVITPDATERPTTLTVFAPQIAGTRTGSSMESCDWDSTVTSTGTTPLPFATLPGMSTPFTVTVTAPPGTKEHGDANRRMKRCPTVNVPAWLVVLQAGLGAAVVDVTPATVVDVVDVEDVVVVEVVVVVVVVVDVVVDAVVVDVVDAVVVDPMVVGNVPLWASAEPEVVVTRPESPPNRTTPAPTAHTASAATLRLWTLVRIGHLLGSCCATHRVPPAQLARGERAPTAVKQSHDSPSLDREKGLLRGVSGAGPGP